MKNLLKVIIKIYFHNLEVSEASLFSEKNAND